MERTFALASPRERAWPLITDTDRFNRLFGFAPVTYTPIEADSATAARFLAETRAGGFKLVYEEFPYEWSFGKHFGVYRRMRGGPVESYRWRCTLDPTGDTSANVTARFEITPRFAALRPVAWLNARKFTRQLEQLGTLIDNHLLKGAASPYAMPASAQVDRDRVAAIVATLASDGVPRALADKLGAFVIEAPDADVVRVRPYELADRWGDDRRDVLRAFLRAVPTGLFELRWGLICPSCQTATRQLRALDEITGDTHCQMCDIRFELGLDRAVEATFLPHPALRRVTEQMFCAAGPARTPHVLVQAAIDAGTPRTLDLPGTPGRFRLFARGGAIATLELDAGGAPRVSATIDGDRITPPLLHGTPGGELVVTSSDARHVKIERLDFVSAAASAHAVSTLPEFRTLFASDVLKPGTPLKVARAAILFTDLTGSTALYSSLGDAVAFRLVDDHFDLLREVVAAHEGVVIKTMGDAVMAAFVDGAGCARAAIDVLARFEQFRATAKHGEHVSLKLGMYAGPCYVVTANGLLDYFGQTVNVASRVQHLAGPSQLILPRAVFESLPDPDRARLRVVESLSATVKGVTDPLDLVRCTAIVAASPEAQSPKPKAQSPT
jgi:adenylate cyclase